MYTTAQRHIIKALGLTLVSATMLTACEGERVDEDTANNTIESNLTIMSDAMVQTITPFEQSEAFGVEGDELFSGSSTCYSTYNDSTGEYEDVCETEPGPDLDAEMTTARDTVIDLLGQYVFTEDHIEEDRRREITYLMKGSNLCKDLRDDAASYSECVSVVDSAQVRLVVTSPDEGDIDIDFFLGEDKRYNPMTLSVWEDRIGVSGDLQNITKSAEFFANLLGEDISEQFPPTFEGGFKVEMIKSGAKSMSLSASVTKAIRIADPEEGYDVSIAQASPALTFKADGGLKQLVAEAGMGALSITVPETEYDYETIYDDQGNWVEDIETETSYILGLASAGFRGKTTFDVDSEVVEFSGVSMNGGPSTVSVDGQQVFSAALNKAFSGTITETGEDTVKIDVSAMTLDLDFSFDKVMNAMDIFDAEDWMLNEQIQVAVSGDAPSFQISGDQLKALAGKLVLKATQRNAEITVDANQCLVDSGYDEPVVSCDGPDSCAGTGDEDTYDAHPFAYLEGGMCE